MIDILLQISTLALAILAFGLGLFTILRRNKAKRPLVVKLWFWTSMAIGMWSTFLFFSEISIDQKMVLLYSQLLHFGAAFIPALYFHFTTVFVYENINQKILVRLGYFVGSLFAVLSFTKLIVLGVSPKVGFSWWIDVGILYPVYLLYFWFYALFSLYFLFKGYNRYPGVTRVKIVFLIAAFVVGFGGGGTNFLPQTLGIYPFGTFVAWLYPVLITYGIFIKNQ